MTKADWEKRSRCTTGRCKEALGVGHSSTLTTVNNLGNLYYTLACTIGFRYLHFAPFLTAGGSASLSGSYALYALD